jgi:hypothetical protein
MKDPNAAECAVPVAPPVPLPFEPTRISVVALVYTTCQGPLAFVLTSCPSITTRSPVSAPCGDEVVTTIGVACVLEAIATAAGRNGIRGFAIPL